MKQVQASQRELAQINTLIATISRSVELLNCDIDAEEERARVRDLSDPEYPVLARHLRTRRDNLGRTLAALRARVQEQSYPDRVAG
jgi:hypothetical protein